MAEEPKPPAPAPAAPAVMASVPWDGELAQRLQARFGAQLLEASCYLEQNFVSATPEAAYPVIEHLRDRENFDALVDLTVVDWPKEPNRFEVVYILFSYGRNERLRVKTRVADGQRPKSIVPLFPAANWLEREAFDMFGVEFAGHPDMRRILLPDEWRGYPLRKDYSILQMDQDWVRENLGIESGQ